MQTHKPVDRPLIALISITGILTLLAALYLLQRPISLSLDSTQYLLGAQFIKTGFGYVSYSLHAESLAAIVDWPPLYSFLLALVQQVSGLGSIQALKLLHLASLFGYFSFFVIIILRLFPSQFHRTLGFICLFLSPLVWDSINHVLSEVLFICLFMGYFTCLLDYSLKEEKKFPFLWGLWIGLLGALLTLTRYAGIFILFGTAIYLMLLPTRPQIRKWMSLLGFLTSALVGVGGWFLRNYMLASKMTFLETHTVFWDPNLLLQKQYKFFVIFSEGMLGIIRPQAQSSAFASAICFFFFLSILAIFMTVYIKYRNNFSLVEKSFIRLSVVLCAVYLLGLNIFYQKYGGLSNRYFNVLWPIIVLMAILALKKMWEKDGSFKGLLRSKLAWPILIFLSLTFYYQSVNLARRCYYAQSRPQHFAGNFYATYYLKSPWLGSSLEKHVHRSDILVADGAAPFVHLFFDRPALSHVNPFDRRYLVYPNSNNVVDYALKIGKKKGSKVFVLLDLEQPKEELDKWQEYLGQHSYRVIQEDSFTKFMHVYD